MMRDGEGREAAVSATPIAMLVADDPADRALVRLVLEEDGWRSVETPLDITMTLRALHQERGVTCLILVLDMLESEGLRGLALLDAARRAGVYLPIVVLGRHTDVVLRRRAAALGVVDIVDLPVTLQVLQQRLRFALGDDVRRRARVGTDEAVRAGGLALRMTTGEVSDGAGWTTRVTQREAAVLAVLMRAPGHPVGRDDLFNEIWGQEYNGTGNVLEVYIRRLRKKLSGAAMPPRIIATVRNYGYVFDARQVPRGPFPKMLLPTVVLVIGGRHGTGTDIGPALVAAGYQVEQISADEQLDRIGWQRPVLILLDTPTFIDGGRGMRARLRALLGAALIPIIAILERGQTYLQPLDLDVDDYLMAPFDPDELLWRVTARARPDATRGTMHGKD